MGLPVPHPLHINPWILYSTIILSRGLSECIFSVIQPNFTWLECEVFNIFMWRWEVFKYEELLYTSIIAKITSRILFQNFISMYIDKYAMV